MTVPSQTLDELDRLLTAIGEVDDPRRADPEWKQVYRLLQKTDLPARRVSGVVGMRNVAGLAEIIQQLRAPAEAAPDATDPDPETCRRALRAFRKRAKVTRLDEESKLGRGPLSKGADKGQAAITPPVEFPDAVWQALVRQGKLRYIGHGLYEPI